MPPGIPGIVYTLCNPAFFGSFHLLHLPRRIRPPTHRLPVRQGYVLALPAHIEDGAHVSVARPIVYAPVSRRTSTVRPAPESTGSASASMDTATSGRIASDFSEVMPPAAGRPSSSANDPGLSEGTSLVQLPDMAHKKRLRCRQAAERQVYLPGCHPPSAKHEAHPARAQGEPAMHCPGVPSTIQPQVGLMIPTPLGRRRLQPTAQVVSLLDALPTSPCSQGPAIQLGVTADMFAHVFGAYGFSSLEPDWKTIDGLPQHVAAFLTGLPLWRADCTPTAIQVYVDGSFFQGNGDRASQAGWALCILGEVDHIWHWMGFVSAHVPPQGNGFSVQTPIDSAFEMELAAVTFALAYCVNFAVPAMIGHDNAAAGDIAFGCALDARHLPASQACLSMQHLMRCWGQRISKLHIRSHTGHPLNDFVDAAAKQAALGGASHEPPLSLADAQQQDVLPWLWMACGLHPAIPAASETGLVVDPNVHTKDSGHDEGLAQHLRHRQATPKSVHFDFKIATYNALSLVSLVNREGVDLQLHDLGIALAGIQETRQSIAPRTGTVHYHVLASQAQDGQLGCQLWLHRDKPVARGKGQTYTWDPNGFSIVSAGPRHLLATARAGGQSFALLTAHAPTSVASEAERQTWWRHLSSLMRRIPPRHTPIVLLDANARFEWRLEAPAAEAALNSNAQHLAAYAQLFSMKTSSNMLSTGARVVSYHGPQQQPACLDYLLVPQQLGPGFTLIGTAQHFQGCAEHDHFPVTARLTWVCGSATNTPSKGLDTAAMRTPEGKARIQHIMACAPTVDWELDVDQHLAILNQHFRTELVSAFPRPARKPRSGIISQATWTRVQDRRDLKRLQHQLKQVHLHHVIGEVFAAWRGQPKDPMQAHMRRLNLTAIALQQRRCSALIKISARNDAAEASRTALAEARAAGPEALYTAFRNIIRAGRRFKEPKLAPVIVSKADGLPVADSFKALGDHFAKAERAQLTAAEDLKAAPRGPCDIQMPASKHLSIPALAQGFSALKVRKAAGPSGLPAELYRADPVGAAALHAPIVYKAQLRGSLPTLWTGGLAHAIPKPQKHPSQLDAWRSILLCEPAIKAIGTALRTPLLQALESLRTPGQGGSRPKAPLQVPMATARGFMNFLKDSGACGALIFVDGRNAFYATVRERLLGRDFHHPADYLAELADAVYDCPRDRLQFLADAIGPGLLSTAGVDPAVRSLLAASLTGTWFATGDADLHFYKTRTGTSPGSPLADVQFQVLFAEALGHIEETMQIAGRAAQLTLQDGTSAPVPSPTWMDDLAVPVQAQTPPLVLKAVSELMTCIARELQRMGIDINLGAGKSEVVPIFQGPRSRIFRKEHLCATEARVEFVQGDGNSASIGLVPDYVHLGSVISASGTDAADIQRRLQLARDMLCPMLRLLKNKHLAIPERVDLLLAMPIARFRHGAGLWVLRSQQERKKYEVGYAELLRRAFRKITGLSSRHLTDLEICELLAVATAQETRDADLVRHLGWLLQDSSASLRVMWTSQGPWIQEARQALSRVARTTAASEQQLWEAIVEHPDLAGRWARSFLRRIRKRRQGAQAEKLDELRALRDAQSKQWLRCASSLRAVRKAQTRLPALYATLRFLLQPHAPPIWPRRMGYRLDPQLLRRGPTAMFVARSFGIPTGFASTYARPSFACVLLKTLTGLLRPSCVQKPRSHGSRLCVLHARRHGGPPSTLQHCPGLSLARFLSGDRSCSSFSSVSSPSPSIGRALLRVSLRVGRGSNFPRKICPSHCGSSPNRSRT